MARIFDDIVNDRPANIYAGLPVKEVAALNEVSSDQYQKSRAAKDALDIMANNLDLRDVDYQVKKRVIEDTRNKFKDLTSRGDYQNAQYLVQDVTKGLATDNQLQGAIQSRQKELAYHKDLKDQLDKGEINQDIYNYGISESKRNNISPVEYDPNTLNTKNVFKGQNIAKDLSKEIYDNMDKRIKDWMPESVTSINGQQFKKSASSPTGYFNVTTGKQVTESEVHRALKTELENTGEYRDFLNQEKTIDFNKQFRQPDGSYRDLTKYDVGKLGLSDSKIKTLLSGVSESTLDNLSKSKNKKDQEDFKKYSQLRDSVNPDTLSKDELKKIYNYAYSENQSDKYVNPATAKADYQLFDDKYLEDRFGLENLKFKHDFNLQKAKKELDQSGVIAAPENVSQLQQYKYSDILKQQQSLSDVTKERDQIIAQMPVATEATRKELQQRLAVLNAKANTLKTTNTAFEDGMVKSGYNINNNYADYVENKPEDRTKLFTSILSLPANKISASLSAAMHQYLLNDSDRVKHDPSSMNMREIVGEISKYPEAKKVFDDYKANVSERLASVPELSYIDLVTSGAQYRDEDMLRNALQSDKSTFLEKEKTKSLATRFISVDDNNNNKESDKGANRTNIEVRDLIKSQVTNPSSEFTTESGVSIYDIASQKGSKGYELVNKEGKATPADLNNTKINLTSQTIGGKVPVGVTFYDANNNPLYFDDEQKGQATVLAYPKNDNVTLDGLKRIGENYLKNGKTNSDRFKGVQYLANTEYKSQLDNQIAPDFWTDKPKGYVEDITLNIKGQPAQFKVIKENTGSGDTEFSISADGRTPITFFNTDGSKVTTFKNLEQASTILFYNNNYDQVAPYIK